MDSVVRWIRILSALTGLLACVVRRRRLLAYRAVVLVCVASVGVEGLPLLQSTVDAVEGMPSVRTEVWAATDAWCRAALVAGWWLVAMKTGWSTTGIASLVGVSVYTAWFGTSERYATHRSVVVWVGTLFGCVPLLLVERELLLTTSVVLWLMGRILGLMWTRILGTVLCCASSLCLAAAIARLEGDQRLRAMAAGESERSDDLDSNGRLVDTIGVAALVRGISMGNVLPQATAPGWEPKRALFRSTSPLELDREQWTQSAVDCMGGGWDNEAHSLDQQRTQYHFRPSAPSATSIIDGSSR